MQVDAQDVLSRLEQIYSADLVSKNRQIATLEAINSKLQQQLKELQKKEG